MSITATVPSQREFTIRAIVIGALIAAFTGAVFPYVILKLGFGPNISLLSTFLGFIALGGVGLVTGGRGNRFELNLCQTAGVAAGQVAFMCVLLAAFDLLNAKPGSGFSLHLSSGQIFIWLLLAGCFGIFAALPFRRHFIDEEKLPFVGGMAAAETIRVLDADPSEARSRSGALGLGLAVAMALAYLRDGALKLIPASLPLPVGVNVGMGWSLLAYGSGMLIGLRITLSMLLGMILSWIVLPPWLVSQGYIPTADFGNVLKWMMWPATGLMVAGGLTGLVLKWRSIARAYSALSGGSRADASADDPAEDGISNRTVVIGLGVSAATLAVVQVMFLQMPIHLSLLGLVVALPLMLAGIRVLGETNWAPISYMANVSQGLFAVVAPGNVTANMVGSGVCGTIPANGEHLIQNLRAARQIGARTRHVVIMQLICVAVGAAALSVVYPLLRDSYSIGGKDGLSSPISQKWAGFGELMARGVAALPPGCLAALGVAVALGVIITVFENRWRNYLPSPTGIGMAMLMPGAVVIPMVLGGLTQAVWARKAPASETTFRMPIASGFIAGEAFMAIILVISRHV